MTNTLKPCPCGYAGALAGISNGTHLTLSCPECSREVEAFTLEGPAARSTPPPAKCCSPTDQELEQLKNGDYTPQELWGASEPSCPKCVRKPT